MYEDEIIINTAAVPEFRRRELAKAVLDSLQQAMQKPGAEEEFQAWLRDYRAAQDMNDTQREDVNL